MPSQIVSFAISVTFERLPAGDLRNEGIKDPSLQADSKAKAPRRSRPHVSANLPSLWLAGLCHLRWRLPQWRPQSYDLSWGQERDGREPVQVVACQMSDDG